MTRVQTVVPLAESDGRNQTAHSDEQKSEWASQRQQSLRRDGRERIISRRVSSTVNPVCFDQCRLIRHQWPQSQTTYRITVKLPANGPVNMYWIWLSWRSYKTQSCNFSVNTWWILVPHTLMAHNRWLCELHTWGDLLERSQDVCIRGNLQNCACFCSLKQIVPQGPVYERRNI